MSRYLLPCQCGKELTVDPGQSGGKLTCECGAILEVPTLRAMRDLPPAREGVPVSASQWTGRQAIAATGVIVSAVLAAVAAYVWLSRTPVPQIDPVERNHHVDELIDQWPPAFAWQNWEEFYRPMRSRGFAEQKNQETLDLEASERFRASVRDGLLILAGIVLVASCAVALVKRS